MSTESADAARGTDATFPMTTPAGTAARPQPLVCRLRKKTTGRAAAVATAGEVELENLSAAPIEVEVTSSPLQYLDLRVIDPTGRLVSAGHYGDAFSPLDRPYTLRLAPGEKYVAPVGLLANVPEALRRPGTYRLQAVFVYGPLQAVSAPFTIDLPARPAP